MSCRSAGGGRRGYLRITGCTNRSGTALYKGIFFSLSWFSELGKGASERILKIGIRLFRCRAVAFLCKWQIKWNALRVAPYLSLIILQSIQGAKSPCLVWPSVGFQLCAHREHVTEGKCAPNYFRSQWRTNRSNAICKNPSASPQTTYRCPWSQWQHCPARKRLTIELPVREGVWARMVNYQPVLQVPKIEMTSDSESSSDLDCC